MSQNLDDLAKLSELKEKGIITEEEFNRKKEHLLQISSQHSNTQSLEAKVNESKWYQKPVGIIALLILFFPVGLFLMWKYANWNNKVKWAVTGVFALLVLIVAITPPSETTKQDSASQTNSEKVASTSAEEKVVKESENNTPTTKTEDKPAQSSETVSQKNAVKKAKSYLEYTAFSRDGLVAQLEFEKFSHADAVYGADNAGADWNEQAAKKAKSYMEYSSFSRGSLIEQLKFDKFTQAQAEYGANSVGL